MRADTRHNASEADDETSTTNQLTSKRGPTRSAEVRCSHVSYMANVSQRIFEHATYYTRVTWQGVRANVLRYWQPVVRAHKRALRKSRH